MVCFTVMAFNIAFERLRGMAANLLFRTLIAAAAIAGLGSAFAATPATVETAHPLGGQLVPLPEGQWQLLAGRDEELSLRAPAGSARIGSMVAAIIRDDVVVALVVARANMAPVQDGFGMTELCRRTDLYATRNDTPAGSLIATCQFVGHALQDVGPGSASAWIEAVANLRDRGLRLPVTWLIAGFRVADEQDLLDVAYLFNPEVFGFTDDGAAAIAGGAPPPHPGRLAETWGLLTTMAGYPPALQDPRWIASSWKASRLEPESQRELLVRHLVHWADTAQPSVLAGFKNRSNSALPMPRAWAEARTSDRERNGSAAPSDESLSLHERAVWKTLTWRSLGSGLDALVAYGLTGSAGVAGAITMVGGMVNAAAYFAHERLWDAIGSPSGPGERLTELPAVAVVQ